MAGREAQVPPLSYAIPQSKSQHTIEFYFDQKPLRWWQYNGFKQPQISNIYCLRQKQCNLQSENLHFRQILTHLIVKTFCGLKSLKV